MKKDKKIRPWMRKVAKSIVINVVQYYKDYEKIDCIEDVAQEIANAKEN